MTTQNQAVALIALRVLEARLKSVQSDCRENFQLDKGSKVTAFADPDEQTPANTLGTIFVSNPKPTVVVHNENDLAAWAAENVPEAITSKKCITDMDAAIEALEGLGFTDLIAIREDVADFAIAQAKRCAAAGDPVDGVHLEPKPGTLSVRPSKNADELVEHMVRSGALNLADVLAIAATAEETAA